MEQTYSSALEANSAHLLLRALEGYVLRPKLTDLRTEGCKTPARGEANDAELIREGARDIQRLNADGSRGAEYDEPFHTAPPITK